jgi:hypothetical protein
MAVWAALCGWLVAGDDGTIAIKVVGPAMCGRCERRPARCSSTAAAGAIWCSLWTRRKVRPPRANPRRRRRQSDNNVMQSHRFGGRTGLNFGFEQAPSMMYTSAVCLSVRSSAAAPLTGECVRLCVRRTQAPPSHTQSATECGAEAGRDGLGDRGEPSGPAPPWASPECAFA